MRKLEISECNIYLDYGEKPDEEIFIDEPNGARLLSEVIIDAFGLKSRCTVVKITIEEYYDHEIHFPT